MSWPSAQYVTAVSVLWLVWSPAPAVAAQRDGLFSPIDPVEEQLDSPVPAALDAITVRRRLVTMDLERLQRARAAASVLPHSRVHTKTVSPRRPKRDVEPGKDGTLTLNLFEDIVFTGIVERTAPTFSGGYSISGRVVGEPVGTLTLVVNGETVAGTVRTLGGTYRIRSVGSGLYAISEVEEPPLECDVVEPDSGTGDVP